MSMATVVTVEDELARAIRAELIARPDAMILELARAHRVPELAVLQLIGAPRVVMLDAARWETLLRALPALGDVRVLASNAGVTMESRGTFGGFSRTGPYFNVQTDSLDLHLRWDAISGIAAVEKPSHQTGHPTASIQLFDSRGAAIIKIFVLFGERSEESGARRTAFAALRSDFTISAT